MKARGISYRREALALLASQKKLREHYDRELKPQLDGGSPLDPLLVTAFHELAKAECSTLRVLTTIEQNDRAATMTDEMFDEAMSRFCRDRGLMTAEEHEEKRRETEATAALAGADPAGKH